MKILVTGGTGFIGNYLVKALIAKNHNVRCLVRKTSDINKLKKLGTELWFGDLTDKKSLRGIMKDIDIVFHLAAIGDINAVSKKYYAAYKDVNVMGTINLLEECANYNIKKFIHFSSIAAMGNLKRNELINEKSLCNPKTAYEMTKHESEAVALEFWKKYNIPLVILRPSMVYGDGERKEANKIEKSVKLRVVPILGSGNNLIHMVHVNDVVKAAMLSMKKGRLGEIYIISGESYTWNDLVDMIAQKMGIRILKLHIPIFASRVLVGSIENISKPLGLIPPFTSDRLNSLAFDTMYDISKARKELGYRPKVTFLNYISKMNKNYSLKNNSSYKKKSLNKLKTLIFFITNKCNLKCKHCFYSELNKTVEELSIKEIKKTSHNLGYLKNLLISGGEPFTNPKLPDICKIFSVNNHVKLIHIPTNGQEKKLVIKSLRKILEMCQHTNIMIGISLEGKKNYNDSIRGVGTFDKTVDTLNELVSLKSEFPNLFVNIITTVTKESVHNTPDFFEYVKNNFDIDYHCFDVVRGNPRCSDIKPPNPKEWIQLYDKLLKYDKFYFKKRNERGIILHAHLLGKKYVYKLYSKALDGVSWPFECKAGEKMLVLEPDGGIRFCELDDVAFNIRSYNYDIYGLMGSKKFQQMKNKSVSKLSQCKNCTHPSFIVISLRNSSRNLIKAVLGLYK